MSVKNICITLATTLIALFFILQFTNGVSKTNFTHSYCNNKYQEKIELTYNGIMYSYHHYFIDDMSRVIFNQDVSGIFFRIGNYYLTYPFKMSCYSGSKSGVSLSETSLFNVFYKQNLKDKCKRTLLFLPARGIATIDDHKLSLSSLLLSESL